MSAQASSSRATSSTSYNPITHLNAAYAQVLLANAGRISRIESSLRSLTYFVPGQTLSSEGMYTALNLVTMYHDYLVQRAASQPGPSDAPAAALPVRNATSLTVASPHSRYTRWWIQKSKLYKTIARLLSVIGYCQLLLEMAGKKYKGEKGRWNVVIGLESVKAFLRLILLRLTSQRTLLQPGIPEREVDPSLLAQTEEKDSSPSAVPDTWKGTRTGFEIPTIASIRQSAGSASTRVETEISAFLQKKVLTIDRVRKPYDLVRRRKGLGIIAEIVWILRPLAYVLALKRYGKRSVYPFLLSLALEYFAYQNMAESLRSRSPGSVSEVEKQELARRRKAFWSYFLRGPLWYGWTRERIEGFSARFGGVFGIGLLANIADDYKHLIDDYHYCQLPCTSSGDQS